MAYVRTYATGPDYEKRFCPANATASARFRTMRGTQWGGGILAIPPPVHPNKIAAFIMAEIGVACVYTIGLVSLLICLPALTWRALCWMLQRG